jgi:hypothetical protein
MFKECTLREIANNRIKVYHGVFSRRLIEYIKSVVTDTGLEYHDSLLLGETVKVSHNTNNYIEAESEVGFSASERELLQRVIFEMEVYIKDIFISPTPSVEVVMGIYKIQYYPDAQPQQIGR